ncbi:IniB N-terminal domain-containing protein [Mycobacterium sp. MYCO198283]|uniref:IniB N-terminal domain-containing protein n=1 Tax=Mycobacterium sp. MYCO198283 TaxID=2883505 RepID=UPI001E3BA6E6|nr:IniB N-terminal domain-containing protein [Mycobacterium sp. MYCO198283]MCG5432111.1 IniB N-terminal domain-containing protein [Mycobacterium sp. MYCO198283]
MTTLIDFILDLFRDPFRAQSFVNDPDDALRVAGLSNVTAAQLQAVAATAAPAGVMLGGGDPIVGLQRAVADHHQLASNFASPFSPQTSYAPNFAPETNTDLLSGNEVASPDQHAGANAQNGAFNLGFGDITFGDKTSNTATNGGVVVDGDNDGDIVSGDGAVLGDNNDVNNGDVVAGSGSHVAVGRGNEIEDNSQHAGGDVISDNQGTVIKDNDLSGGHGGGAAGGDSLIGIGSGGASGGDGGNAGSIIVNDSHANSGTQTHVGGDSGSDNTVDNSVHTSTHTDTSTEANTSIDNHSSSYESSVASHNDTDFASHNDAVNNLASHNDVASDNGFDAF